MTAHAADVTIATNVHNGRHHVDGYLFRLRAQTVTGFKILVLDDGSTDGTPDRLEDAGLPNLSVLRRAARGLRSARKDLVEQVETPFVMILDIDHRLEPTALERMLAVIDEPGVGGVSVRARNRTPTPVAQGHDGVRRLAYRLRSDAEGTAEWLEGSPTLWRMAAIDAVGGLSTAEVSADLDLSLNVRDAGYRLVLLREDLATHPDPATWKELWRREASTGRREGHMIRRGTVRLLAAPRLVRIAPILLPAYLALLPVSLLVMLWLGPPRLMAWLVLHWMNLAYSWGFLGGLLHRP